MKELLTQQYTQLQKSESAADQERLADLETRVAKIEGQLEKILKQLQATNADKDQE